MFSLKCNKWSDVTLHLSDYCFWLRKCSIKIKLVCNNYLVKQGSLYVTPKTKLEHFCFFKAEILCFLGTGYQITGTDVRTRIAHFHGTQHRIAGIHRHVGRSFYAWTRGLFANYLSLKWALGLCVKLSWNVKFKMQ